MRCYIDLVRVLFESDLPAEPHLTRRFDMMQIGNRRFMFNPRTKQFLLGHALGTGRGKSIRSSHAEEYHDVHRSNTGFDAEIRGWVGTGPQYPHGIIHFAPPITSMTWDAGYACLEAFRKNGGASDQTVVRAFAGVWEQPLVDVIGAG